MLKVGVSLRKKPLGDAAVMSRPSTHIDADIRSTGDGARDETVRMGQIERELRHPVVEDQ
jgi:hypothetical protein